MMRCQGNAHTPVIAGADAGGASAGFTAAGTRRAVIKTAVKFREEEMRKQDLLP